LERGLKPLPNELLDLIIKIILTTNYLLLNCNKVHRADTDQDHGISTQYVYAATIDAGKIYTDQTGRFPVVSSKGNKYIMVLYDYDSNAILAQPIKDRTAPELLKAFQFMEQELLAKRLTPKLMKLDN
jgi:hypothetical protein